MEHGHHTPARQSGPPVAEAARATERDPVCGMDVDPAAPRGGTTSHEGNPYFFCSPKCREKFVTDPSKYLVARPMEQAPAGARWTCPMHPQVVKDGPGLKGEFSGLLRARSLSRDMVKNIRQNLFLAFAYNTIGIPIAAGLLYPAFGLLLSPMIASAAMSLSSVSVIANALRLRAKSVTT